jgi:hypothetical protein
MEYLVSPHRQLQLLLDDEVAAEAADDEVEVDDEAD